jgi:hypothetical protein
MNEMAYITPGHVNAFQAIRSQLYDNITLSSCKINGEPGVAIIMLDHVGEGKVAVMPLFVAITNNMELEFPGGGKWSWDREGNAKDEMCQRAASPDAEQPKPDTYKSMTLEAIGADPWNAVRFDVPENASDRLLYTALDASVECAREARRNIEAARTGKIKHPEWNEEECGARSETLYQRDWQRAVDRYNLLRERTGRM